MSLRTDGAEAKREAHAAKHGPTLYATWINNHRKARPSAREVNEKYELRGVNGKPFTGQTFIASLARWMRQQGLEEPGRRAPPTTFKLAGW